MHHLPFLSCPCSEELHDLWKRYRYAADALQLPLRPKTHFMTHLIHRTDAHICCSAASLLFHLFLLQRCGEGGAGWGCGGARPIQRISPIVVTAIEFGEGASQLDRPKVVQQSSESHPHILQNIILNSFQMLSKGRPTVIQTSSNTTRK